MAAFQNFRSALNGFNREDVVRYIEFINNKHNSQVNQLNTEIQTLQAQLDALQNAGAMQAELTKQLAQFQEQNAALEAQLAELQAQLEQAENRPQTDSELEAYRRAERAERIAKERVSQLYAQANGLLADATVRTDEAVSEISGLTDQVCEQLSHLQTALCAGANTIRDTAAAMYAIKPIPSEE